MSRPTAEFNQTEITALVVLMAEARVVPNTELKTLANVDLSGPSRTKLVDQLGLVTQSRVGRGNAFSLSPKGREACLRLLAAQPPLKGSAGGALIDLLAALHRAGISADDFAGSALTPAQSVPTQSASGQSAPVQSAPAKDASAQDAESQVRAAYKRLATSPGGWVALADLRDALQLGRADVDAALRGMARKPDIQLIPVANLKSLQQRDKDAALKLGGEDNHVLSIESS